MASRGARRKGSGRSPLLTDMSADERADFIAPEVHSLARELGNADIEVAQGGYDDPTSEYWAASSVPCALVPFITTLSFDGLHRALGNHPELYWHPIVRAQIGYLQTLQLDGRLWEKFRWGVVPYCYVDPPQQVQRVTELLQTLIAAHADAIVLGRRVDWKRKLRTGPRVGFRNPHPEDLRLDSEIDPLTLLHREFPKLRAAAQTELDRAALTIRLGGTVSKSTRKALARVCFEALKQSEIELEWLPAVFLRLA